MPFKPFTFSNRLKRKLKSEILFYESTFTKGSKGDLKIIAEKMRDILLKDLEYKIHFQTESQLLEKANNITWIKKFIEYPDLKKMKKKHNKNLL